MSRETFRRQYRLFLEGKSDKPWPASHGITRNQAHNIRRSVKSAIQPSTPLETAIQQYAETARQLDEKRAQEANP